MLDTLSNVKQRLGITDTLYDDFLTEQIETISDVIEHYCRRKFLVAEWDQTFYDQMFTSKRQIELYHYPVREIVSIKVDGENVDQLTYRLHKPTGILTAVNSPSFFRGCETVVRYKAGYDSCPRAVLSVLDSLVGERYNKKKSGIDLNFGSDIQRISIPGTMSLDYDYTLTSNERTNAYGHILGNNLNILDSWRSERAVMGSSKLEYVEGVE